MAGLNPEFQDYELPVVSRTTIDQLIDGSDDSANFTDQEWQKISTYNPDLRDLITLLASRAEPNDLEARQKQIDDHIIVVGALERTIKIEKLTHLLTSSGAGEVDPHHVLSELEARVETDDSPEIVDLPAPHQEEKKPPRIRRLFGIRITPTLPPSPVA